MYMMFDKFIVHLRSVLPLERLEPNINDLIFPETFNVVPKELLTAHLLLSKVF